MSDLTLKLEYQLKKGFLALSFAGIIAVWWVAMAVFAGWAWPIYLWIAFGLMVTAAVWLIAELLNTRRTLQLLYRLEESVRGGR